MAPVESSTVLVTVRHPPLFESMCRSVIPCLPETTRKKIAPAPYVLPTQPFGTGPSPKEKGTERGRSGGGLDRTIWGVSWLLTPRSATYGDRVVCDIIREYADRTPSLSLSLVSLNSPPTPACVVPRRGARDTSAHTRAYSCSMRGARWWWWTTW